MPEKEIANTLDLLIRGKKVGGANGEKDGEDQDQRKRVITFFTSGEKEHHMKKGWGLPAEKTSRLGRRRGTAHCRRKKSFPY